MTPACFAGAAVIANEAAKAVLRLVPNHGGFTSYLLSDYLPAVTPHRPSAC